MTPTLQTPFNPTQVEILKLFSQGLSNEQLEDLRRVLVAFRFKLLDEHLEKIAKANGLTLKEVDQASKEHRRRPYKAKNQRSNTSVA